MLDNAWAPFEERIEPAQLPLFPKLAPFEPLYRDTQSLTFMDPFLEELARSGPLQRLKRIGFLGAIDYVRHGTGKEAYRRRHNRYDHTIGVARLALTFAEIAKLNERDTRVLAAAALLHDVGHGPLSHTLEPIFKARFGIHHHYAGRSIVYGRSKLGSEIPDVARRYRVDLDEVQAMIDGQHDARHAFVFSSPINLDTIEGITRSRAFFAPNSGSTPALKIVAALACDERLPIQTLDAFWRLKHEIYNVFIHNNTGLIYDGLAQAYMLTEINSFSPDDFLRNEEQLQRRQNRLFYIFSWAKHSQRRLRKRILDELFEYELTVPKRNFTVDSAVKLESPKDLDRRYKQTKSHYSVTMNELVPEDYA